jgi:hypothetical protein
MGWEGIITAAVSLMALAERLIAIVRGMGVSQQDVDKAIAENRAARAKALEDARGTEWPT